jgi:hypothetical protein
MRFFRSEETVRAWQARQPGPLGEVLTLTQVRELSQLWYHNRLAPDFHGRTTEQIVAIFRQVGLTAKFWYPDV